jgi:hypothetical protein
MLRTSTLKMYFMFFIAGVLAVSMLGCATTQKNSSEKIDLEESLVNYSVVVPKNNLNLSVPSASKEAYDSFFAERKNSPEEWTIFSDAKRTLENGSVQSYSVIEYIRGSNQRFDIIYSEQVQKRSYVMNNSMVTCNKNSRWSCITKYLSPEEIPSKSEYFSDPSKVLIAFDGTQEILNKTTNCYIVSDAISGLRGRYCLYDGMIFYLRSDKGPSERIASQYVLSTDSSTYLLPGQ